MSEYSDWACNNCMRSERVYGPLTPSRSCICGVSGGMRLVAAYQTSGPGVLKSWKAAKPFSEVPGARNADELQARLKAPETCTCSTRQLMGYFGAVGGGGCPRKRGGLSCYVL